MRAMATLDHGFANKFEMFDSLSVAATGNRGEIGAIYTRGTQDKDSIYAQVTNLGANSVIAPDSLPVKHDGIMHTHPDYGTIDAGYAEL